MQQTVLYLAKLPQLISQASGTGPVLRDYPDCGVRNNRTVPNWTEECLWDCAWMENPYFGREYNDTLNGGPFIIKVDMPKIPRDLRCLNGCVYDSVKFQNVDFTSVDCSQSRMGKFLCAYYFFLNYQDSTIEMDYFYLAAQACMLSVLEPAAYPAGSCLDQHVFLGIHNLPSNKATFSLSGSRSQLVDGGGGSTVYWSNARLVGPITDVTGDNLHDAANTHPWLCSLRTPSYRGRYICILCKQYSMDILSLNSFD